MMSWSTVAAWVSAGAAVGSLWFAYQKNEREKASAQPTRRIPATPTPPLLTFPTTYATAPSVQLESEVGADYSQLQKLLAAQHFKEADQETTRLILWVASREEKGYLGFEDIKRFPCRDLHTINQLWVQYSSGRFGFSVQRQIYNEVGKNWSAFGNRVGWRRNGVWLDYKRYSFEFRASAGHLPICRFLAIKKGFWRVVNVGWFAGVWLQGGLLYSSLARKFVDCNL